MATYFHLFYIYQLESEEEIKTIYKEYWRSGEGPGCPGGRQVNHEPAVCPGCQEGQWDPGVHQEEGGQQDVGGSPYPLHCPSEASSRVLCPVLGSPVQER